MCAYRKQLSPTPQADIVVLRTYAVRFWSYVNKGSGTEDECWRWTKGVTKAGGYGVFGVKRLRRVFLAHRVAWLLLRGAVTHGQIRHQCSEPRCVNPSHMTHGLDREKLKRIADAYFRLGSVDAAAREQNVSSSSVWLAVRKCGKRTKTPREAAKRGPAHPLWRGGQSTSSDGYIVTSQGVRVHRTIGALMMGRDLACWETVHHVDDNKKNNAEANLVIMPMREHSRFHTFLRHRSIPANRDALLKFCVQESDYYFRFTTATCSFWVRQLLPTTPIHTKPKEKCRIKACVSIRIARGYCSKHYQRQVALKRGYWQAGSGRKASFTGRRFKR